MGKLPSGSSLPPHWDDNMDRLICEAEGEGVLSLATIVNRVKNNFKDELREVRISSSESLAFANGLSSTACDSH